MQDWIMSGKRIDKSSVSNVVKALREMETVVRFDEFSRDLTVDKHDDLEDAANRLAMMIEQAHEFCPNPKMVLRGLNLMAERKNPVIEWLKSLKWDKVDRLSRAGDYFRTPDTPLNHEGIKLIFRGIVGRVFEPGTFFKYLPILKGPQNAGKSTAMKILGGSYYVEGPEFNAFSFRKDLVDKVRGKFLVEQEELAGMGRADRNKLKATISQTHDTVRLSYGTTAQTHARQFIMVGTANEIPLTDLTGNVRFVVIDVGKIDLAGLKRDRDQLFAQAVAEHKAGSLIELPEHVWEEQQSRNETERVVQDVEVLLEEFAFGKDWIPQRHIMEETKGTFSTPSLIKVIMEKFGFRSARARVSGAQVRGWVRIGSTLDT